MLSIKRSRSSQSSISKSRSISNQKNSPCNDEKDKIDKDKKYLEYLQEKEQLYLQVKHKTMCQKTLIMDCKRCEICLSIDNKSKIVFCDLCEDAFHICCLKEKAKENGDKFYCHNCINENSEKIYNVNYYAYQTKRVGKNVLKVRNIIISYNRIAHFAV